MRTKDQKLTPVSKSRQGRKYELGMGKKKSALAKSVYKGESDFSGRLLLDCRGSCKRRVADGLP